MSPCFATPLGPGLGTYRRAGVPRGVCGEGGRLAWRSWAGAAPSSLAPLHRHVEELELEEPCEERTVALQPPAEKKMVRRESLDPWGTPSSSPDATSTTPLKGAGGGPAPALTAVCCTPGPPSPRSDRSRRPLLAVWRPWGPHPHSGRGGGAGGGKQGPGASQASGG